jgi:ketosteroid isomerase-like protein/endonuclease/exonuclease/phosphatase family metal-dependent hydrolase
MADPSLSVLTWNVYLGADVSRVVAAAPRVLLTRMSTLWQMVKQTDFPARAKAIAAIIHREQPDVIALQEVYCWRSVIRHPLETGVPSENPEYDFLSILLDELSAWGATYFAAARMAGVNVLLPTTDNCDIRLEDSVVILLRAGVAGPGLAWEKPRAGRFAANLKTAIDGDPFKIERGWASVDLRIGGGSIRIITTHLEYFSSDVQPLQLAEILDGPAAVGGPQILMGDFNGRPGSATWEKLKNSGYIDAWEVAGSGSGYTSSQDEDLRNRESVLYERIDWVFCRGSIDVLESWRVGIDAADRGESGMWPSDHAGVMAKLLLRLPEGENSRPKRKEAMEQPTEPVEVVTAAFDRFIAKDVSGVMDLVAPDSEWFFPGNPDILPWAGWYRGAGLMRFFIACAESLEYLEYKIHSAYAQGEIVTLLSSEKCRVRKTGKVFENQIASIVRVEKGKIVRYVEYADTAAMHAAFESK